MTLDTNYAVVKSHAETMSSAARHCSISVLCRLSPAYLKELVLQQLSCRGTLAGILDEALAHNVSHGLGSATK